MIEVNVKDEDFTRTLTRIVKGMQDPQKLMISIAGTLETETERNFKAEGRPDWMGLKPSTIKRRTQAGTWPGKILQVSGGGLAASIATDYGRDFARIGSNKRYAAIQQLGGQAGRGKKVRIDPRPYLPVDARGNLQPETQAAIQQDMSVYLRSLAQ